MEQIFRLLYFFAKIKRKQSLEILQIFVKYIIFLKVSSKIFIGIINLSLELSQKVYYSII